MRNGISWKELLGCIFVGSGIGIALFALVIHFQLLHSAYHAYVVTSGSMEPALKVGSVIFTRTDYSYSVGEIITFKPEGSKNPVSHRIIGKTGVGETLYITKGDANEEEDATPIRQDQIIGRSFITAPYLGHVVNFAKTPKGFVALVVIPAAIIIYEELKIVWLEIKKFTRYLLLKLRKKPKSTSEITYKKHTNLALVSFFLVSVGVLAALATVLSVTMSFFADTESAKGAVGIATAYPSPTPSASPSPSPANLVINELLPQPTESGEPDWVELYNPTSLEVSLVGWALDEGDQNPKPLDSLVSIPAGGYIVYEHTNASWLDNVGETLELLLINPSSQVVDTHTYTSSTPGVSIGRETDGSPNWHECLTVSKNSSNNSLCL